MGLKLSAAFAAVTYAWGTIAIAMAHHEGSQAESGGGSTSWGIIVGGIIAVGIIAFILFRIWDKKYRRGRRREA